MVAYEVGNTIIKQNGMYPTPIPPSSERVRTNQIILTSDGVELIGDLYVPVGNPPFPAVIEITPYDSRGLARLGEIYATRGYLFLAVDVRGRYRSSGAWDPLTHDQADGHEVIQWLAGHELCNRRIGSRGHSYSGYNQLLAAIDGPDELKAMVVGVAPGDPFENVPFQGGAYDLNDLFWLLSMTGRADGISETGEDKFSSDEDEPEKRLTTLRRMYKKKEFDILFDKVLLSRPFRDIDLRFGVRQNTFREWINHWQFDDFWEVRAVGQRLSRTAVPTLFISGWWNGNGRGSTAFFRGMRLHAKTSVAREAQRLLIGPWDHDLRAPDCGDLPEEEARSIQRAALRDPLNDEFAWFDLHLMDIEPGPATNARVTLFVTGSYQWMNFDDWPSSERRSVTYYLAEQRKGKIGSLRLSKSVQGIEESTYIFNPDDPTPFAPSEIEGDRIPFDNSDIEGIRKDILLFDTEPIQKPIAMVGELTLVLYARADAPDFDLCAKLLDLYPDGRAIYLADGIIRARFRKGWDRPELIAPGEINRYSIDLWHIGHVLRKNHALRLEISSGAFLRFDVNPCTGGELAGETESRSVKVTIVHSFNHPSRLILPISHEPGLL